TGSPVRTSADFSCATVQSGWRSFRSAAPPATCGVAILVPLSVSQVPYLGGTDERMPTPGPVTSGLSWCVIGVGPPDEKYAITFRFDASATVIASGAFRGESTVPFTLPVHSLYSAITGKIQHA